MSCGFPWGNNALLAHVSSLCLRTNKCPENEGHRSSWKTIAFVDQNIICSQAIRPVIFDPLPPLDPVKKTAATLVILCTLCLAMNEVDSFWAIQVIPWSLIVSKEFYYLDLSGLILNGEKPLGGSEVFPQDKAKPVNSVIRCHPPKDINHRPEETFMRLTYGMIGHDRMFF